MATQLAESDAQTRPPEAFFLKHVDDKGDHLLVDDNLNITGIIDWQMTRIVPRLEASWPLLVTADMSVMCNGKVSLSEDDSALVHAPLKKASTAYQTV